MSVSWAPVTDILDPYQDAPGLMACRLDLQFTRPGKDAPMPLVAGRAPDRVGVLFYDMPADASGLPLLKAGDRLQMVSGPIAGTFELRQVPEIAQDYLGAHHGESQVIEISAGAAAGQLHAVPRPGRVVVSLRPPLVFGMVDGSTLVLGLFLGVIVARQSSSALWHAALGGGLAAFGGMSLGQYWSAPEMGKLAALVNGAGTAGTTIIAGLPFALLSRTAATIASAALITLAAVIICLLREETGKVAVARTFGLLLAAGALSGVSGLI